MGMSFGRSLEVLDKKERELSVLRSSLKVDDGDVGYISDDASVGNEDEVAVGSPTGGLNGYGPSPLPSLATLMSNGTTPLTNEALYQRQKEKEKLAMDLQNKLDSLAYAKMIISSLEKANKSMMED
jgi:hypothetical protein